jgi:LPXTG-motif cell wall-anchored protein
LNEQVLLYTLPATGGTGELPYILFGSAMLSGAFILLLIRRKKEAAH